MEGRPFGQSSNYTALVNARGAFASRYRLPKSVIPQRTRGYGRRPGISSTTRFQKTSQSGCVRIQSYLSWNSLRNKARTHAKKTSQAWNCCRPSSATISSHDFETLSVFALARHLPCQCSRWQGTSHGTLGGVRCTRYSDNRCDTLLTRYNHPRVGQNLLIGGDDLLGGYTCTPPVSQRSESGNGIMGAKTGNGMLLCMLFIMKR
jgi:hypothetical protein